jgi:hypothetical protein
MRHNGFPKIRFPQDTVSPRYRRLLRCGIHDLTRGSKRIGFTLATVLLLGNAISLRLRTLNPR